MAAAVKLHQSTATVQHHVRQPMHWKGPLLAARALASLPRTALKANASYISDRHATNALITECRHYAWQPPWADDRCHLQPSKRGSLCSITRDKYGIDMLCTHVVFG